jgi:hypothetical protein
MTERIPKCTDEKQVEEEDVKSNSIIKLWVGYDKDGEVVGVRPGEAATCFEKIDPAKLTVTTLKALADAKNKDLLAAKTTTILSVSGSDPCLIMIGNIPVWVC